MGTDEQQQNQAGEEQQTQGGEQQQTQAGEQQQTQAGEEQQTQGGEEKQTQSGQLTEKPEVTDEHKEKAKDIAKAYNDDLQTTTLPGSGGTVSGTAVTDWVDEKDKGNIETSAEEGKVEYRKTEEFKKKLEE